MKIGIITFQSTSNFGSFFQTVALYRALDECGVDCEVINYKCKAIEQRERMKSPQSARIPDVMRYFLYRKHFEKRYNTLENRLTELVKCSDEFNQYNRDSINDNYDGFVVGSDLVWSMRITGNDLTYYLDFAKGKRSISYASSIGSKLSTDEISAIKEYLPRFDYISVREEQTAESIKELLNQPGVCSVCDPTMLLFDCWDEVVPSKPSNRLKNIIKNPYILMYFPDSEGKMRHDAKYLADKYGYSIICINSLRPDRMIKNCSVYLPEDFIYLIKKAKIVLSGSYHGTLFSIYNRVPFYYYIRSHSIRMDFLANKLDFRNRHSSNIIREGLHEHVEFDLLYKKLYEFRNESTDFLHSAMEDIGWIG